MKKILALLLSLTMVFLVACSDKSGESTNETKEESTVESSDESVVESSDESMVESSDESVVESSDESMVESSDESMSESTEGKELATATKEQDNQSVTMKYYGDGDIVKRLLQTNVVKNLTDEQKTQAEANIQKVEEVYNKIDGVTYKAEIKDNTITETLDMNLGNKETLRALVDQNILQVQDKNIQSVSLEQSLKLLEQSGFKVTRNN